MTHKFKGWFFQHLKFTTNQIWLERNGRWWFTLRQVRDKNCCHSEWDSSGWWPSWVTIRSWILVMWWRQPRNKAPVEPGGARWSPVEPRGPALADFFAESTSKLDQVRQIIKTVLEICGEWFFVVLFETENNCFPGEETNNTTFDSQFWASNSEDIFTVIPALTNSYKTMLPYFATHIWTGFLTSVLIILLKSSDKKWLYM